MKQKWVCGCGLTHHLDPGSDGYKCAFCGHVRGEEAPATAEPSKQAPLASETGEPVEATRPPVSGRGAASDQSTGESAAAEEAPTQKAPEQTDAVSEVKEGE